jgi:hypothetical protein
MCHTHELVGERLLGVTRSGNGRDAPHGAATSYGHMDLPEYGANAHLPLFAFRSALWDRGDEFHPK